MSQTSTFDLGFNTSTVDFGLQHLGGTCNFTNAAHVKTPDAVVLSMGSHHKDRWGFDEASSRRFDFVFSTAVKELLRANVRKIVLSLESARDSVLTPNRFASPSEMCVESNWRRQQRNRVMTEALARACAAHASARVQCRVLDIYSPTVSMTGFRPGLFFRDRDPIHFMRPGTEASRHMDFVGPMLHQVLGSFTWRQAQRRR